MGKFACTLCKVRLYLGKVLVFGQKCLYSEQIGCIWALLICYSGKLVVFGQNWFYSGKLVVFGQNWLYSDKLVIFGQKYVVIRANLVVVGQYCL